MAMPSYWDSEKWYQKVPITYCPCTLTDVLGDISDICDHGKNDTGTKILTMIKNTMSDRAATESKFNNLLQAYRADCLPKCIDGGTNLPKKQKKNSAL